MRKHSQFQTRHYNKLAMAIRNHIDWDCDINVISRLVTTIADMLEKDNPNFSREKFIRRCGWH